MELQVYTKQGTPAGRSIEVSNEVFGVEPNDHAVYLAVQAQMTNSRHGTSATKTRSMVSGGGKKPWKQKGRGGARAGTIRSPLWRGGGIIHGPQPHPYSYQLPKKVKSLARVSVLSAKAKDEQLKVVEDFTVENAKTKDMAEILKKFNLRSTKTLFLLPEYDTQFHRASRNIKNLKVAKASDVSTYDLLDCTTVLILESAVKKLEGFMKS